MTTTTTTLEDPREVLTFSPDETRQRCASDLVFDAPTFTLVPQANKIANVSSVVDAIADGCYSSAEIGEAVGMCGRQGAYYPHAAHTLGLVERVSGMDGAGWQLTDTGAAFVGLDAGDRVDYLCGAISEIDWIATYVNEGLDALRAEWSFEQDLGATTIDRRLATISSWIAFWTDTRVEQTKMIAEAMTGTRERTPGIVARVQAAAQARRKSDRERDARKCSRCHIVVAPAVGECENCGTALAA